MHMCAWTVAYMHKYIFSFKLWNYFQWPKKKNHIKSIMIFFPVLFANKALNNIFLFYIIFPSQDPELDV